MNDIELTVAALEACGYRVHLRGAGWYSVGDCREGFAGAVHALAPFDQHQPGHAIVDRR